MDYNQWCRLCATTNGAEIDVFSTSLDLKELILKHFGIMITVEDKICKNCYGFIEKLVQFIETIKKANQMFLGLKRREDSHTNYDDIIKQYEYYEPIKFELIDCTECSEKSDQILSNIDPCISIKTENVDFEDENHLEQPEKQLQVNKMEMQSDKNTRNKSEDNNLGSETIGNSTIQRIDESTEKDDQTRTKKDKTIKIERSFKKFRNKRSLNYEQRYACPYCDKKFKDYMNFKLHRRTVHLGEKLFVCEQCGKRFGTIKALKGHIYGHKPQSPCKCLKCGKEFKTKSGLNAHKDTHSDAVYRCPQCGLQLKTRKTLTTHMLVHSDEKKYKCEHCGVAFKRSGHLKRHLISHIGFKPYSCPFCGKTFTTTHNVRLHISKVHSDEPANHKSTGTELVKITCDTPSMNQLKAIAGQVSSSKVVKKGISVKEKEDVHKDTVYCCSKCGIQLKTKSTLNTHMLVHSDEKKYKCDRCEKAFKRHEHLKRHLISHLGLKPYSCKFCDKPFTNSQNCRLHIIKVHSDEFTNHKSTGTKLDKIKYGAPSMNQLKAMMSLDGSSTAKKTDLS